tara:strand:+ start:1743 stop:2324 length:582 start_codon:yes stop_codon:yes gene_type:complete
MSALPFNLNTTTTSRAKGEKVEYITPGAHKCKITGLTTSETLEDYKGSPFIQYAVKSESGKVGRCRFWVVKETDKQSTREWKTKQIKDFLINAGVKDFSDDSNAMNDAIHKDLMIAFISEEYIGINKENQEPVIRTATKYRWSAKVGGKCTYNNDMNQTLTDEQMAEFSSKHAEWSKANSAMQTTSEDEDMPF